MIRRKFILTGGVAVISGLSGCMNNLPVVGSSGNSPPEARSNIDSKIAVIEAEMDTVTPANSEYVTGILSGEAVNTTTESISSAVVRGDVYTNSGDWITKDAVEMLDITSREVFEFELQFFGTEENPRRMEQVGDYKISVYSSFDAAKVDPPEKNTTQTTEGNNSQQTPSRPR